MESHLDAIQIGVQSKLGSTASAASGGGSTNFHQASPMLEILVAAAIGLVLMAKKRPQRRGRKWLRGVVLEALVVGTLANSTLIGGNVTDTVSEKSWLASLYAVWTVRGGTSGEGPLRVGVAHSDYSDAEVEEWIENNGSWDEGDLVQQEVARRKIRYVGAFQMLSPDEVLNDGRIIRTKLGWIADSGESLKIWAYNASGAAPMTTGAIVGVAGEVTIQPK